MRPLVHVEAAEPDHPEAAARRSSAWVWEAAPLRRGVTFLTSHSMPLPGATVTPWVLRGIDAAIPSSALPRRHNPLGDCDLAQRVFDGATLPVPAHARARELRAAARLPLRLGGVRSSASIPREWIGTNLLIAAPLVHRRDGNAEFAGPVSTALAELAGSCGVEGKVAVRAQAGAQICRAAFATATLVLDATWWTALDAEGRPTLDAVPIEHCLVTPSLAMPGAALAIDAWISSLLGHPPRSGSPGAVPKIAGQRRAWPRAPLPAATRRRNALADRAFEALWRAGRRSNAKAALAPSPSGRFARVWAKELR